MLKYPSLYEFLMEREIGRIEIPEMDIINELSNKSVYLFRGNNFESTTATILNRKYFATRDNIGY